MMQWAYSMGPGQTGICIQASKATTASKDFCIKKPFFVDILN
jgi:hypothetical protein